MSLTRDLGVDPAVQLAVGFQRLTYYPGEWQYKIEGRLGAIPSCAQCFSLIFSTGQQERWMSNRKKKCPD
jgi:hypothetical protein